MTFTRRSRSFTAIIALISMLYMQLAVAAYACPGLTPMQAAVEVVVMADMPGCSGMDAERPSLCYASGQSGKQSLDKPPVPGVPPFLPVGFATLLYWGVTIAGLAPPPSGILLPARLTDPPLTIRNCCFRL